MAVAEPQLGEDGLSPEAQHVALAGPIGGLRYPPACPNCGEPATMRLPIAKVFRYNHGPGDDAPWSSRTASAAPLFCPACLARHRAEQVPVTLVDRLKSCLLTELALPALGAAAFGLFLANANLARIMRDPQQEWPLLAMVLAPLCLGLLCLRLAWTTNAHRRVERQTPTSRAFDFGDDATTIYRTSARTYAIRDPGYARALHELNEARSAELLGPGQRRRENRTFWITAIVVVALALAGYLIGR